MHKMVSVCLGAFLQKFCKFHAFDYSYSFTYVEKLEESQMLIEEHLREVLTL